MKFENVAIDNHKFENLQLHQCTTTIHIYIQIIHAQTMRII